MDLREVGFGDVDWIHMARDSGRWRAVVNTAMNTWFLISHFLRTIDHCFPFKPV
jgi:hypothetical protein